MRTWLITGANSGIGLALTDVVLAKGDKVIAAVRNPTKIPASIASAVPLQLDLNSSYDEISTTATTALKEHGPIDILVNCAGWALPGYFEELDHNKIIEQFQTNVHGPMSLIKVLLPSFRERKSGLIINVSSVAGFTNFPGRSAYNASKAAFDSFTESLAAEVQPFNIRVLLLEPGFYYTPFLSTTLSHKPQDEALTGAYTTPISLEAYLKARIEQKKVGDPVRLAGRVWDLTQELEGDALRNVVRIPLGGDSATVMKNKLKSLEESIDLTEAFWSTTDMSLEQVEELRKATQG